MSIIKQMMWINKLYNRFNFSDNLLLPYAFVDSERWKKKSREITNFRMQWQLIITCPLFLIVLRDEL